MNQIFSLRRNRVGHSTWSVLLKGSTKRFAFGLPSNSADTVLAYRHITVQLKCWLLYYVLYCWQIYYVLSCWLAQRTSDEAAD